MSTIARNTKSAKRPAPIVPAPFDGLSRLLDELRSAVPGEPHGVSERRTFVVAVLEALVLVLVHWKRARHAQNVASPFLRAAAKLSAPPAHDEGELDTDPALPAAYGRIVAKLGGLVSDAERAAERSPDGSMEALVATLYTMHRTARLYARASADRVSYCVGLSWSPAERVSRDGGHLSVDVRTRDQSNAVLTHDERVELRRLELAAFEKVTAMATARRASRSVEVAS